MNVSLKVNLLQCNLDLKHVHLIMKCILLSSKKSGYWWFPTDNCQHLWQHYSALNDCINRTEHCPCQSVAKEKPKIQWSRHYRTKRLVQSPVESGQHCSNLVPCQAFHCMKNVSLPSLKSGQHLPASGWWMHMDCFLFPCRRHLEYNLKWCPEQGCMVHEAVVHLVAAEVRRVKRGVSRKLTDQTYHQQKVI